MICITIPGEPVSWKAHGGYGRRSFNPRFREKEYFQYEIKKHYSGPLISEAVRCNYVFEVPIPKGFSKVKRTKIDQSLLHPTKRPDLGNYEKFLSDCLIGLVLEDDSCVVQFFTQKVYSAFPKTIIEIEIL